jgi:hypothetical protein
MTEAEWLASRNHSKMLEFLGNKASDRKLRLFSCACCRHIWDWIEDEGSREAVRVAELFADGLASDADLDVAAEKASAIAQVACDATTVPGDVWQAAWVPAQAALTVRFASIFKDEEDNGAIVDVRTVVENTIFHARVVADQSGREDPIVLLRDIFGPLPFRPVTLDRSWLTPTVTSLAQAIYTDRAFDRLPILADALEDSGCANQQMLEHCRSGGEHVRGCWVVDLLTGRE